MSAVSASFFDRREARADARFFSVTAVRAAAESVSMREVRADTWCDRSAMMDLRDAIVASSVVMTPLGASNLTV
jgi:hypothetical protein